MTALAADRNTPRRQGDILNGPLAASVAIFVGAIVMRNAAGYLTKGAAATGLVGVGVAQERRTGGAAAGDERLNFRDGTFRLANSGGADEITIADIGTPCFAVDDQTVAKTDGTGTRSVAGFVADVDAVGVWVTFDEALLQTYLAGVA